MGDAHLAEGSDGWTDGRMYERAFAAGVRTSIQRGRTQSKGEVGGHGAPANHVYLPAAGTRRSISRAVATRVTAVAAFYNSREGFSVLLSIRGFFSHICAI